MNVKVKVLGHRTVATQIMPQFGQHQRTPENPKSSDTESNKEHLLLPSQMGKLRPREARSPPNPRSSKLKNGRGGVEHAQTLGGLPLTSCGSSHKPLALTGPRPRVRTEPRRRAPKENADSMRDGPASPRHRPKPRPPHPILRLSYRISSAW